MPTLAQETIGVFRQEARQKIAVDVAGRHEVIDRVDARHLRFDRQPDGRQLVIADKALYRTRA